MSTDDVMEPLIRLRREMEAVAEQCGVVLESFLVVPSDDEDGNHIVQALFHVEPVTAFASDEQRHFDEAFAEIAEASEEEAAAAEVEARRDKLRDSIANLKGGGIFPDDE